MTRARIASRLASLAEQEGRYRGSLQWARRGLRTLEGRHQRNVRHWRGRLQLDVAAVWWHQQRLAPATQCCIDVVDTARRAGDAALEGQACLQLEMCLHSMGDARAHEYARRGVALFEALGDDRSLGVLLANWGYSCYNEGDWDVAVAYFARAEAALERSGHLMQRAAVVNNRALLLLDRGLVDEADDAWADAARTFAAGGIGQAVAVTDMNRARVAARKHRSDDARARLRAAHEHLHEMGITERDDDLATLEVERLVLAGRFTSAVRAAGRAAVEVEQHRSPVALRLFMARVAAEAQLGAGRVTAGANALRTTLALARDVGSSHDILLCLHTLEAVARAEGTVLHRDEQRERRRRQRELGVVALPRVVVNPSASATRRGLARPLAGVGAS